MGLIRRVVKRPVEVEAVQFTDLISANYIVFWMFENRASGGFGPIGKDEAGEKLLPEKPVIYIDTLEGRMYAPLGWWVIKGVKGEFYPCDPEVFAATYDFIKEE